MSQEGRLLEVATTLYSAVPADFTPARSEAEKSAKADGDPELAAAVKALRKPSVGAWVVNLLVRREADQIDQVLELAGSLRAAAESLDGEELRALTRQRKQLTGALTTRARQLALENGSRLSAAVADQVEATLTAAMLDPAAAEAVRTGLLITTLSATGLGEGDHGCSVAVPQALGTRAAPVVAVGPALHVVPENKRLVREAAQERVEAADEAVRRARKALDRTAKEAKQLEGQRFGLRSEIDELQRRIDEIENRVESLDEELEVADQDHDDAGEALAEAEAERNVARAALDAL